MNNFYRYGGLYDKIAQGSPRNNSLDYEDNEGIAPKS